MADNLVCVCCGKTYSYCGNCNNRDSSKSWKKMFDNEKCRRLFFAAGDLYGGDMTEDEFRKVLTPEDFTTKYQGVVQKMIDKVRKPAIKKQESTSLIKKNDQQPYNQANTKKVINGQ